MWSPVTLDSLRNLVATEQFIVEVFLEPPPTPFRRKKNIGIYQNRANKECIKKNMTK